MTREALRTKMTLILLALLLAGVTAGAMLVRGPIDIRNRASEPNKCEAAIAICVVPTGVPTGEYDDFIIQIIDGTSNELIQAGGVNETSVETPVESGKVYTCRVIGVTSGGARRDECPVNAVAGTAPFCQGPTPTPTRSVGTPTPSLSQPSPTPFEVTPFVTGPVFQGCPINIKTIEPILCVTDGDGRCLTEDTVSRFCADKREWKLALSSKDKATIDSYSLIYRLAVYEENGGIIATSRLNDTRDTVSDETEISFPAQTGLIYTGRLEVFDETRLNPLPCTHLSGRLRCTGITPPPGVPTTTVRIPTPVVPTGTTITTCVQSTGDLNLDGNVDVRDVNLFVRSQFSGDNRDATDVNCDRKVDSSDWSLLFSRVFGS
jgi:hypothetical protein